MRIWNKQGLEWNRALQREDSYCFQKWIELLIVTAKLSQGQKLLVGKQPPLIPSLLLYKAGGRVFYCNADKARAFHTDEFLTTASRGEKKNFFGWEEHSSSA